MPDRAILPKPVEIELTAACRLRLPNETCGVLFGCAAGSRVEVDGYSVIRNESPQPRQSFVFSPSDWTNAYYEAQKNQRNIVGFFHSHPGGRPLPSARDAQGWLPWGTYWIIAVTAYSTDIAVYAVSEGSWKQMPLSGG